MNSGSVKKAKRIAVKKMFFWSGFVVIFIATVICGCLTLIHIMGIVATLHGKLPGIVATAVNDILPGTRALALYAFTVIGVISVASVFDKLDDKHEKTEAPRLYNVQ